MMTFEEAKNHLGDAIYKGVHCPCCGQLAKVYRRPLNRGMAKSLISMYRRGGLELQHIPTTIGGRSREEGKLAHWNLIRDSGAKRDDGGRAGFWRVTQKGKDFVEMRITVPKYVHLYDSGCIRLDGKMVNIKDCLGTKFDYDKLMAS